MSLESCGHAIVAAARLWALKDTGGRRLPQAPEGRLTSGFRESFRSLGPLCRTRSSWQIVRCHDASGDFELELAQLIELIAQQCGLLELQIARVAVHLRLHAFEFPCDVARGAQRADIDRGALALPALAFAAAAGGRAGQPRAFHDVGHRLDDALRRHTVREVVLDLLLPPAVGLGN